ncbi:MAG: YbgA family protein [Persicimonas sp.]
MERQFPRPRVILSACLELEACRHDGQRIADSFIRLLLDHIEVVPICPEVEIGLGVPRDYIRLVADGDKTRLVQPSTHRDLTDDMHGFSQQFLESLSPVEGFVLKSGSPSCGLDGVKVYNSAERGSQSSRSEPGLFAGHVLERHGDLAVETDGRLRNHPIRHHFLTQIYAFAELRYLGPGPTVAELADFQRRHKHLLMTYDQHKMRLLGAVAANSSRLGAEELYANYTALFREALAKMPTHRSYINSLSHMYGHFKEKLAPAETHEFLAMLEDYRDHRLPLHALLAVVRTWASRFEYEYFADQSLLEPYPRELIQMRDSGKGVDF